MTSPIMEIVKLFCDKNLVEIDLLSCVSETSLQDQSVCMFAACTLTDRTTNKICI